MKKLNLKLINPEAFTNKRSYEAAVYAATICNRMFELSKQGHIILEYENLVKPEFRIDLDDEGNFTGLVLKDGENACVMIVGDEQLNDKIYCLKRTIREYFKLWRVCRITNVVKATDLTKGL